MSITIKRKQLLSFASLYVFLSAQIVPCLAQALTPLPAHMPVITPPVIIEHQHTGIPILPQPSGTSAPLGHQNYYHTTDNSVSPSADSSIHHQSNDHTQDGSVSTHNFSHHWQRRDGNSANNSAPTNSSNRSLSDHNQYIHHEKQIWANLRPNGTNSASSINLDLSSTSATMTASHLLHGQTVYINAGGNQISVTAETKLTPAEYLALKQIEFSGQQTLVLDAQGSASGGTVVIGQHLSQLISNLVIPQGVTVIDLTRSGALNLSGNIIDNGSLYIESRNPLLSSVSIDANNISVQGHGTLSDIIPAGTLTSFNNGHSALDTNLNLNLDAVNNITNSGTIYSAGAMSLTAGGSIVNTLPAAATGITPVIQSVSNLNLVTSTGNITNTGLIQSTNSNINILSSIASNNINIDGSGSFQAANGNINVRDASYTGNGNININGGNYLSDNLNLYSGTGTITGLTGEISGNLNTQAGVEHLIADTSNLNLGNNNISGDPTFVSTGNITITGANTFSENVAIIAEGNITAANNTAAIIDSGHNVTLIAGATVNVSSGGTINSGTNTIPTSTQNISGATGTGNGTGSYTANVNLASPTGGNIDLSTSTAATVINTYNGSGAGGNVTLVALANGGTGGNIILNTSSLINTSGTGAGNGGNVTIYAGANSGTSITTGRILTTGGSTSGSSGIVTISTTQAVTSDGNPLVFNANGTITSGNTIQAASTLAQAGISAGEIDTYIVNGTGSAGNVNISAHGNISVIGGGGIGGAIEAYNFNAGSGTGGTVSLTSSNGSITTGTSTAGTSANGEIDTFNANASGAAGNVTIVASGNINIYGGSGSIGGGAIEAFNSASGSGGTISITSYNGYVSTGSSGNPNYGEVKADQSGTGSAGAGSISVVAAGNITINGGVHAANAVASTGSAGNITLSSTNGSISTYDIEAYTQSTSTTGTSGTINVTASGSITTNGDAISNQNNGVGAVGNIIFTASTGSISALSVNSGASGSEPGGNVSLTAYSAINITNTISSLSNTGQGGNVTLIASAGTISAGSITTSSAGSGSSGYVSISAQGNINIANGISTANIGTPGAGANITITSTAGSFTSGQIDSYSASGLAPSGSVNITAYGNIAITGSINTFNFGGTAAAGNVTLISSSGSVTSSGVIDVSSAGTGAAGNLTIASAGAIAIGGNLNAPNTGGGAAGNVTIKDGDALDSLYIGAVTGANYINGNISANGGSSAGFIDLQTASNVIISSSVTANSASSGTGGKIQFTYLIPTAGPVNVQDNGTVSATNSGTNTSGIVGFNGGANNTVNLTGSGTLMAGNYVGMGSLDPVTLTITGTVVPANMTNNFTKNMVTVLFPNGGSPILNAVIVGGTVPPSPSSPGSSSGLTPQQILFYDLNFLALQQSLQQQANTRLYEQIGTKVATDYTPYTSYPNQPQKYPLEGAIKIDTLDSPGEALFAASAFNANELTALTHNGIVFGPKSGNDFFDLVKGHVLFMPSRDIKVQTREGIAYIPKGAAAWIMETGNDSAIFDLHDTLWGGVIKIVVNNKPFTLAPGKELLLTKNTKADFSAINPGNAFGYRNVQSSDLGSGIKAYVCDFSIAHGITNVPVIHSLLVSNDPSQRKAARKILMNQAILADLTGYPEYQH